MEDSELFNVLIYLSILSPLFPLGVILFSKLFYKPIAILLLLLSVFSFTTDIISLEFAKVSKSTDTLTHIYTVLSGLVIYAIYFKFIESVRLRRMILFLAVGLVTIELIESFVYDGLDTSNFLSYTFLSLSILMLSLLLFFRRMNKINARKDIFDHLFWLNSAFLLYYGSTLIITLFENYIRFESPKIFIFIWPIQLVANVVFNLLLVKGLWTMRKT